MNVVTVSVHCWGEFEGCAMSYHAVLIAYLQPIDGSHLWFTFIVHILTCVGALQTIWGQRRKEQSQGSGMKQVHPVTWHSFSSSIFLFAAAMLTALSLYCYLAGILLLTVSLAFHDSLLLMLLYWVMQCLMRQCWRSLYLSWALDKTLCMLV